MTWDDVLKLSKTKTPFSCKPKPQRELKKQHTILFSTVPSRDNGGKKVVTDDDVVDDDDDDDSPSSSSSSSGAKVGGKLVCQYGTSCYQSNPSHLAKFHHPPVAKDKNEAPSKKTPCKWGSSCYLTSKQHMAQYSHPAKGGEDTTAPAAEGEQKSKPLTGQKEEGEEDLDTPHKSGREEDDDLLDVVEDPHLDSDEEMVAISRKEWHSMQSMLQEMSAKLTEITGAPLLSSSLTSSGSRKRGVDSAGGSPQPGSPSGEPAKRARN
jgi:hypothetical protein